MRVIHIPLRSGRIAGCEAGAGGEAGAPRSASKSYSVANGISCGLDSRTAAAAVQTRVMFSAPILRALRSRTVRRRRPPTDHPLRRVGNHAEDAAHSAGLIAHRGIGHVDVRLFQVAVAVEVKKQ